MFNIIVIVFVFCFLFQRLLANMNTQSRTHEWIFLKPIPINKCQFRIAFNELTRVLYVICNDKGILKYSVSNNTWTTYQICNHYALNNHFFRCSIEPAIIDSSNVLYMLTTFGIQSIASINLKSTFSVPECPQKWRIKHINYLFPDIPKAVIINDKMHFVSNCKHFMYDPQTLNIFTLHDNVGINYCSNLLKVKDKLISFGAYDVNSNFFNHLIEYDIIYNKWIIHKNSIPAFINAHSTITILNDQFILLFGGYHKTITIDESIWYCSFSNMTHFTESIIKCPGNCSRAFIFTFNDDKYDQFIVFCFIKFEWLNSGIPMNSFPPKYLLNLMQKYYMNQWIHFIDLDNFGNKGFHWKIDVFDILH